MDIAQFRLDLPEFIDTVQYTDENITFWSTVAEASIDVCRWGTLRTLGVYMYTAHEITIEAQNKKAAASGGQPGAMIGVPSSKTVGSVSVASDAQSNSEKNAGYWNLTNYGKKYWRLAQIYGAGCVQL